MYPLFQTWFDNDTLSADTCKVKQILAVLEGLYLEIYRLLNKLSIYNILKSFADLMVYLFLQFKLEIPTFTTSDYT